MELKIQNLIKKFGDNVALNISELNISKGTIMGLVGNNGAGKTTLFRLILDLLKADNGYVLNNGIDVSKSEIWKSHTGSFIDSSFLIEFLTAEEYFYFVGETYGLNKDAVNERLQLFTRFMNNKILGHKKYIRNFSAGNKQKIGIIAAMMIRPEILILDEPFNFLDPSSQIEIRDMILKLNQELNTTVLISSHNLSYTTDISSRIILLENGVIKNDLNNSTKARMELSEYFIQQTSVI